MCDLCRQIFGLVVDLFRSRAALEAEVLVLKQQIIVLRRGKPNRMSFLAVDRFVHGHYSGHHGLLGAAAGCVIGRYEANKRNRLQKNQVDQPDRDPRSGEERL
jgi:hypothetical protein